MATKLEHTANEIARSAASHTKISANKFVARRWENIRHAGHASRANKDVILLAIRQEGCALQYANLRLRENYDIVLIACKQNGLALEFASDALKCNNSICLEAVKQNGEALQFVDRSIRTTRDIMMAAVGENMLALVHICEEKELEDETLIQDIVKQSVRLMWHGKKHKKYGEPDFQNMTSQDFLEHYADSCFGKVPSRESDETEMKEEEEEEEKTSLTDIKENDSDFMRQMKLKLKKMLKKEENKQKGCTKNKKN